MPKLRSLIGGLLALTSAQLYAQDEPYAVPFEVGQRVEIILAKPYLSAEGVRVHDTSMRLADKDLFTLVAGGQEERLPQIAERGRVQGLLTAVDDTWLTLDLGEKQPLLRIPRVAIVGSNASPGPELPVPDATASFDTFAASTSLGAAMGATLRARPDRPLSLGIDAIAMRSGSSPWTKIDLRLSLAPHSPVTVFVALAAVLSRLGPLPFFETGIRVQAPLGARVRFFVEPAVMLSGGPVGLALIKFGVSARL
jgi:hypothetical protein